MNSRLHRWWLWGCFGATLLASLVGGFGVTVTAVFIGIYLTGLVLIGPDEPDAEQVGEGDDADAETDAEPYPEDDEPEPTEPEPTEPEPTEPEPAEPEPTEPESEPDSVDPDKIDDVDPVEAYDPSKT